MKVLIVANNKHGFAPFVLEQARALKERGVQLSFFGVEGRGGMGYLRCLPQLRKTVDSFQPDLVHAHYGLSGLLANLQHHVPVITTYHGSDINKSAVLPLSKLSIWLSAWNIFVSKANLKKAGLKKHCSLIPCGIDMTDAQLISRKEARQKLNIPKDEKLILFAGAFDNKVKNAPLAFQAVSLLPYEVEFKELKGYSREEVTALMCAADALLLTSFTEGSPQVVKEAMACGCPIVSVDAGDVRERTEGVDGCCIAKSRDPQELADLLKQALQFKGRTKGRERLIADGLDNRQVAENLIEIYRKVIDSNA